MVGTGDAQGLTHSTDAVATSRGIPARPPAWAPSPPVQLSFAAQLEMLILGVGLVAFPVLQLHTQRVGCPASELVHHLIAQPVLSGWVAKALKGRRRWGWERKEGEGRGGLHVDMGGYAPCWAGLQGLGPPIQNHFA